jgi:hypothetical protein
MRIKPHSGLRELQTRRIHVLFSPDFRAKLET